jgi:hypothetical protein
LLRISTLIALLTGWMLDHQELARQTHLLKARHAAAEQIGRNCMDDVMFSARARAATSGETAMADLVYRVAARYFVRQAVPAASEFAEWPKPGTIGVVRGYFRAQNNSYRFTAEIQAQGSEVVLKRLTIGSSERLRVNSDDGERDTTTAVRQRSYQLRRPLLPVGDEDARRELAAVMASYWAGR